MRSPIVRPALAVMAGTGIGVATGIAAPPAGTVVFLAIALAGAVALRWLPVKARAGVGAVCVLVLALIHGAAARDAALSPALRTALDGEFGGFTVGAAGIAGAHPPVRLRARLTDDGSVEGDGVLLRAEAMALQLRGEWRPVGGGLVISVAGSAARERAGEWLAGRVFEAPVTFRRPARYLDDGVPDLERAAALDGLALFGSIKSGLVIELVRRGSRADEAAAVMRRGVRGAVTRWVAPHGSQAAAIVTAVLIGDRTGLPDEVRMRLQAAGTYHVIAISGGNIAILATLLIVLLSAVGLQGRTAAAAVIVVLLAYAQVVSTGPSVWRATLMATLYLAARLFDHRTPPWHATLLTGALMAWANPLDVRDAGFLLTFGATAALLEVARLTLRALPSHRVAAWLMASVTASLAAEVALLPVSASVFSRVTAAGLVLNIVAIPAMAVVQVAGLVVVALDTVALDVAGFGRTLAAAASLAGWVAGHGARLLVDSAGLVDWAPWLVRRVPPPPVWVVASYYGALVAVLRARHRSVVRAGWVLLTGSAIAIVAGVTPARRPAAGELRLTLLDVGQGDAILLQTPGGEAMLVDAGGTPFGGGSDIGGRVVAPAIWARGVRRLDALLVTHGDPDHLGGAVSVLDDLSPRAAWWGIIPPPHAPTQVFLAHARDRGVPLALRRAGQTLQAGGVRLRVLNPPEPDWERQKVRNDDSVVVEAVYGDVAILLTGDISADIERAIAPHLTPAKVRVLKVAHHGSRTSTSQALLDAWHPQYALISCGRGNTFGHPAPEVVARLEAAGARIYRTDVDGEVTLTTDGHSVSVATFIGEKR